MNRSSLTIPLKSLWMLAILVGSFGFASKSLAVDHQVTWMFGTTQAPIAATVGDTITFTYAAGHTVEQFPDQASFGACDFTSATFVQGTGPAVVAAPAPAVNVNSAGEARFRQQLGVDKADPNIRQVVNAETATFVYDEQYPIDKLLFWRKNPEPGVLLDATEEQRRLRENSALGKPVTDGESPTIERKRGGLLQGIF